MNHDKDDLGDVLKWFRMGMEISYPKKKEKKKKKEKEKKKKERRGGNSFFFLADA